MCANAKCLLFSYLNPLCAFAASGKNSNESETKRIWNGVRVA